MKKLLSLLLITPVFLVAQTTDTTVIHKRVYAKGRDLIKMNLSSLLLNNYSFTFERGIGKKMSLGLTYRFMPTDNLPYQTQIKDIIKSKDIDFGNFILGGYAITPEFRLYTHSNMRGFYIAPYVRYSSFDMTVPIKFTTSSSSGTAFFSGNVTAFTGGVLFGTQQNIFKHCVIDFWILGASFGNSNGTLHATNINPALNSPQEKSSFENTINNLDVTPFKVTGKVTSNTTADMDATGPWLGVRAVGINFGVRF